MKRCIIAIPFLLLALAGCTTGTGVGTATTQVSGNVTDLNGDPVRNAKVFLVGRSQTSTVTNSSGAYILANVPEGERVIAAQVTQDGVKYAGQNYARVFADERSKSVNIMMGAESQLARMNGVVRDGAGALIAGARVFAYGGGLSSSMDETDEQGRYEIAGLFGGIPYAVNAGGLGFNSDLGSLTLTAGENRRVDFILDNPTSPTLPRPENIFVTIWTSPAESSTSKTAGDAYEQIKRLIDKDRAKRMTHPMRGKGSSGKTASGRPIEADLQWDPITNNSLLGYAIYRGTSQTGPTTAIDFLRDPETSFFADNDDALREYVNYYYEVTALNVLFPDTTNSESDFSDRYGVRALGDMNTQSVLQNPDVFRWTAVPEAEEYFVFVWDRFPGIGVTEIFSGSTTGTQLSYTGPGLVNGRTYYWAVVAVANATDSRSISRIQSFVAN